MKEGRMREKEKRERVSVCAYLTRSQTASQTIRQTTRQTDRDRDRDRETEQCLLTTIKQRLQLKYLKHNHALELLRKNPLNYNEKLPSLPPSLPPSTFPVVSKCITSIK